jgi:hypothetical protein
MKLIRTFAAALIGLAVAVFPSIGQAVPISLAGESAAFGNLLVRQPAAMAGPMCIAPRQCVPAISITFNNAPAPLSDGVLTVIAAGDIGHRANERTAAGFVATDFVTVFNPANDPLGTLYINTVPNCPGPPPNETMGFADFPTNTIVCGPNAHSVKTTNATDDAPGGSNGTDFFTDQLAQGDRGDSIPINQAELAILAAGGKIVLTLFPNPGATGFAGVGDIKYKSATLTYDVAAAAPEPSTLFLFGGGLAGLVGFAWSRQVRK